MEREQGANPEEDAHAHHKDDDDGDVHDRLAVQVLPLQHVCTVHYSHVGTIFGNGNIKTCAKTPR